MGHWDSVVRTRPLGEGKGRGWNKAGAFEFILEEQLSGRPGKYSWLLESLDSGKARESCRPEAALPLLRLGGVSELKPAQTLSSQAPAAKPGPHFPEPSRTNISADQFPKR